MTYQPGLLRFGALGEAIELAAQIDEVSVMLAVFKELLRLQWTPEKIQQDLREKFGKEAIATLSSNERLAWLESLEDLSMEPSG